APRPGNLTLEGFEIAEGQRCSPADVQYARRGLNAEEVRDLELDDKIADMAEQLIALFDSNTALRQRIAELESRHSNTALLQGIEECESLITALKTAHATAPRSASPAPPQSLINTMHALSRRIGALENPTPHPTSHQRDLPFRVRRSNTLKRVRGIHYSGESTSVAASEYDNSVQWSMR
ncbi:hypothetical protein KEM56_000429, partial [Ascosphaera pollenicola]